MSLRTRVVALVVGAVVLTLIAMGLPGRRIAVQQFEASVHAVIESSGDEASLGEPLHPTSLSALEDEIRRSDDGGKRVWVTRDGRIRASSDPALEGMVGVMEPDGTIEIQSETPEGIARLRLRGSREVTAPDGSSAGRVFRIPALDQLEVRGEEFTRALDRRLLLWAGLVLGIGVVLAIALVGHTMGPLRRLEGAAHRISAGDLAARAGAGGPPEVRAVADAFDRMADHLESSEAARRRMIGNVAHDLRTPLTNLRGQLEALQDGLRELDASALDSLHEEAMLLTRLVADLEALARADEGNLELSPASFDLARLARDVVDGFVKSGRLEADSAHLDLPSTLEAFADRAAVGRALRNLVENAVVHAPGAVVEVSGEERPDQVRLEIRDHGPGIEREHLPHVTERLYRADAARGRDTGGSGLGLAIALELIRASGGALSVYSDEGRGTRVEVGLPASAPEPTRPHPPATSS